MEEDKQEVTQEEKQAQAAVSDYMRKIGQKGGRKIAERGPEYFKELGRKGAQKRWSKKEQ